MLVISRQLGESLYLQSAALHCTITVLTLDEPQLTIRVLIVHSDGTWFDASEVTLPRGFDHPISAEVTVSLVDIRHDKARIGIVAPKSMSVHRLEVIQHIRTKGRQSDDDESGSAPAGTPRTPKPAPPSLDVRLNPPAPNEDGDLGHS